MRRIGFRVTRTARISRGRRHWNRGFRFVAGRGGAEIFGVDPSDNMLAACHERHPGFTVQAGTFTQLPFDESSFAAVISSFVFHEVPLEQRKGACAELARVVKPGGWICVLDIMFVSIGSRNGARSAIGAYWDDQEDYPLVAELDQMLRDTQQHRLRKPACTLKP